MKSAAILPFSLLLLAFAGCFNEPTPAYKSVPAEKRVYLSDKGLKELPKVNAAADYLNLDRNQLTNVNGVAELKELKWLRLNDNRLSALPRLDELKNLRRIYLRNNNFTEVPATIVDLKSLTDIDLSGNPIKVVPDWMTNMVHLKNISFNRTQIKKLPDGIEKWQKLQSLQLGELGLSPEEMARIRKALPNVAIVF